MSSKYTTKMANKGSIGHQSLNEEQFSPNSILCWNNNHPSQMQEIARLGSMRRHAHGLDAKEHAGEANTKLVVVRSTVTNKGQAAFGQEQYGTL